MKHFAFFLLLAVFLLPSAAIAQSEGGGIDIPPPPQIGADGAPLPERPINPEAAPFDWNSIPVEIRPTKEELEAEAQEVYTGCAQDGYLSQYYSCECISGSYLQLRERLGPVPTRSELTKIVQTSTNPSCADVPRLAADALDSCNQGRAALQPLNEDNDAYCRCFAYTFATRMQAKPRPETAYISALQEQVDIVCSDPSKRPVLNKTVPNDGLGVNTPQQQ